MYSGITFGIVLSIVGLCLLWQASAFRTSRLYSTVPWALIYVSPIYDSLSILR